MNWKNKTCEKCYFLVEKECRLNPPIWQSNGLDYPYRHYTDYYTAYDDRSRPLNDFYKNACSKYKEINDSR